MRVAYRRAEGSPTDGLLRGGGQEILHLLRLGGVHDGLDLGRREEGRPALARARIGASEARGGFGENLGEDLGDGEVKMWRDPEAVEEIVVGC